MVCTYKLVLLKSSKKFFNSIYTSFSLLFLASFSFSISLLFLYYSPLADSARVSAVASKYRLTASKSKKCLNSTTQICMCVCLFLVRLTKNMSKVLKHLLKIIPIDRITLTSIHQLSGSYFPLIF